MERDLGSDPVSDSVVIDGRRFTIMIGPDAIAAGIDDIAAQLALRFRELDPVVVCVLNGAAIFHADLVRRLAFPLTVDYLRVASYDGGMRSSGRLTFSAEPGTQFDGRNVILVEDIVDTGRTADTLRQYSLARGARSVDVATLLFKRDAHSLGPPPEHVAFEIPNRFVVGFGLDYRQKGRNLPAIYQLDEPDREAN